MDSVVVAEEEVEAAESMDHHHRGPLNLGLERTAEEEEVVAELEEDSEEKLAKPLAKARGLPTESG